jgi:transcriptional regulator with XRE-family HTH domain
MDILNQQFVALFQASGWRANRAALELCVDAGTVSRYLSGDIKPSMTVLKLFGRLIGEPLRYVENSPPQPFESQPILDEAEIRLFRHLRALHPQQRTRLLEAIGGLVQALTPPPWSGPIPERSASPEAALPPEIVTRVEKQLGREVRRGRKAKA